MPVSEDPIDQRRVEDLVGHPSDKYQALVDLIQDNVVKRFSDIDNEFLDFLWCLDSYRMAQVVPRGMGKATDSPARRLEGVYRGKGNSFSSVMTLILSNKTTSQLASRNNIQGYSQTHQIDIAWPARDTVPLVDPYVCAEAKLTGAPPFPGNENGRGAMSDWSNRRKELKFQATDLKLYRHMAERSRIEHWDIWRRQALPYVYSLWAARLRDGDDVTKMVEEARVLADTYSDGVGIYAFKLNKASDGYESAALSRGVSDRVTSLDSVLELIAARIRQIMTEHGDRVPDPVKLQS
ncbi:hypothetical protein AB0P21_20900 [Kribbella sp. NPDC056861]|uniref:hypothetical protein n=1 Tax=Kribbella sp. NPDC056861 TaxID=3154857 RepID=UPI0034267C5D